MDAVLVADAWHWFDAAATMQEVRRVLRPGGSLCLVWNVVAEPVEDWEHALAGPDMYDRTTKGGPDGVRRRLPLAEPDELEFEQFSWVWDRRQRFAHVFDSTPRHRHRAMTECDLWTSLGTPARSSQATRRLRAKGGGHHMQRVLSTPATRGSSHMC